MSAKYFLLVDTIFYNIKTYIKVYAVSEKYYCISEANVAHISSLYFVYSFLKHKSQKSSKSYVLIN